MTNKAKITGPDTPVLDERKKAIDSGHPRMIGGFIEDLIGLINALGAEQRRLFIDDVNICDLLEMMVGDWDGKVIAKFWGWLVEKHEDDEDQPCVFDIRIQDILHEYFGIDPEKEENELRELLATQRAANTLVEAREDLGLKDEPEDTPEVV